MMSCHHLGKSIPGCLENTDIVSEGHPTSTGTSVHPSDDPEYCFPAFYKFILLLNQSADKSRFFLNQLIHMGVKEKNHWLAI